MLECTTLLLTALVDLSHSFLATFKGIFIGFLSFHPLPSCQQWLQYYRRRVGCSLPAAGTAGGAAVHGSNGTVHVNPQLLCS